MADITASVLAWSATEASNQPTGDTTIGAGLDDNLRAIQAGVAKEHLKGSDIASAGTINPGASGSYGFYDVTGTTTITSLGTAAAGTKRTLRFTGALTLTHNGTSLILPGSTNITTVNGDVGEFVSLGSGNWTLTNYRPINAEWSSTRFGMTSSTTATPVIDFTNTTSDAASVKMRFFKSRSAATTNSGDVVGLTQYFGKDSSNADRAVGYFQFQQTGSAGASYVPGQYVLNLTNSSGSDTTVISATGASVNVPVSLTENSTRVFSRNSQSSTTTTTQNYTSASTVYTFAHGFAGVPTFWQAFAENVTTEHSYAVGDVLDIGGASGTGSVNVSADATNVYVSVAGQINVASRAGTPSFVNLTPSSSPVYWKIFVRAWY